jgi:acyl-CoA reductase-like NAD-dependent aldehyde dehydrogenase
MVNSDLPFGGVGNSGMGRLHGYEGFKSFSNLKSIMLKPSLNFYPYT